MIRKTLVSSLGGLLVGTVLSAAPSLSFMTTGQVVISGVSRGGQVAVISVSHTEKELIRQIVPYRMLITDSDRDGVVLVKAEPIVPKSIWVAVDIATGQVVVGAPTPYLPTQTSFDPALGLLTQSVTDSVVASRQHLNLLLVRPGWGAWHLAVIDGGSGDGGPGSDKEVLADLVDFDTLGFGPASSAPNRMNGGDVLVGIDPVLLEYFVYQAASSGDPR